MRGFVINCGNGQFQVVDATGTTSTLNLGPGHAQELLDQCRRSGVEVRNAIPNDAFASFVANVPNDPDEDVLVPPAVDYGAIEAERKGEGRRGQHDREMVLNDSGCPPML